MAIRFALMATLLAACFAAAPAWSHPPSVSPIAESAKVYTDPFDHSAGLLDAILRPMIRGQLEGIADREARTVWPARLISGVYRLKPGLTKPAFDMRLREAYLAVADHMLDFSTLEIARFSRTTISQDQARGIVEFLSSAAGKEIVQILWSAGSNPQARTRPPPFPPALQTHFDGWRTTEAGKGFAAVFQHMGQVFRSEALRTDVRSRFSTSLCALVEGPDCQSQNKPAEVSPR